MTIAPKSKGQSVLGRSTRELIGQMAGLIELLDQVADGRIDPGDDLRLIQRLERPVHRLTRSMSAVLHSRDRSARLRAVAKRPDDMRVVRGQPRVCARTMVESLQNPHEGPVEETSTIQGTNKSLPLSCVFEFLSRSRKNGRLMVQVGKEILEFHFDHGKVVFSSSDSYRERKLGDVLVERGYVDDAQIRTFLKRHARSTVRIGEAMLEEELVTIDQLTEALEEQVEQRFYRAFSCEDAEYVFYEGELKPVDDRIRMNVMELLFASLRTQDEGDEE